MDYHQVGPSRLSRLYIPDRVQEFQTSVDCMRNPTRRLQWGGCGRTMNQTSLIRSLPELFREEIALSERRWSWSAELRRSSLGSSSGSARKPSSFSGIASGSTFLDLYIYMPLFGWRENNTSRKFSWFIRSNRFFDYFVLKQTHDSALLGFDLFIEFLSYLHNFEDKFWSVRNLI